MKLHRKHLIKQRRENEIPLKLGFSMDLQFTNLQSNRIKIAYPSNAAYPCDYIKMRKALKQPCCKEKLMSLILVLRLCPMKVRFYSPTKLKQIYSPTELKSHTQATPLTHWRKKRRQEEDYTHFGYALKFHTQATLPNQHVYACKFSK